jgi:hypothetical protein
MKNMGEGDGHGRPDFNLDLSRALKVSPADNTNQVRNSFVRVRLYPGLDSPPNNFGAGDLIATGEERNAFTCFFVEPQCRKECHAMQT